MKRLFGGAAHKKGLLAIWKGIFAKIADVKEWKTLDFCNINLMHWHCQGYSDLVIQVHQCVHTYSTRTSWRRFLCLFVYKSSLPSHLNINDIFTNLLIKVDLFLLGTLEGTPPVVCSPSTFLKELAIQPKSKWYFPNPSDLLSSWNPRGGTPPVVCWPSTLKRRRVRKTQFGDKLPSNSQTT